MPDSELIRKYLETKDVEHLRVLFERYESQLLGYLIRILNHRQDAEDALQEAFCKAIRALPKYQETNQFKAWIHRIAHNEAMNLLRRRQRIQDEPEVLERAEAEGGDVASQLIQQEDLQLLDRAIEELPDVERRVVMMRLKSDLPFKEIAKIEGCSINTVLGRMHNAKSRLRTKLKGEAA